MKSKENLTTSTSFKMPEMNLDILKDAVKQLENMQQTEKEMAKATIRLLRIAPHEFFTLPYQVRESALKSIETLIK